MLRGIPLDDIGGPGLFNDAELVWKGYYKWVETGTKPTKAEIESIDPDWEMDLDMIAATVGYVQRMHIDPLTGKKLNVG